MPLYYNLAPNEMLVPHEVMEKEFLAELPGKGLTVTQVTPADQAKAAEVMRKYWPEWAAESKENADILNKVMARLKK